jgi:hypothetical protein
MPLDIARQPFQFFPTTRWREPAGPSSRPHLSSSAVNLTPGDPVPASCNPTQKPVPKSLINSHQHLEWQVFHAFPRFWGIVRAHTPFMEKAKTWLKEHGRYLRTMSSRAAIRLATIHARSIG